MSEVKEEDGAAAAAPPPPPPEPAAGAEEEAAPPPWRSPENVQAAVAAGILWVLTRGFPPWPAQLVQQARFPPTGNFLLRAEAGAPPLLLASASAVSRHPGLAPVCWRLVDDLGRIDWP